MNIIEPGVVLNPNTTKLVHCKACDATWADKKIPKICPHCGAGKSKLAGAKDDECESFMEAYMEALASSSNSSSYEEDGVDVLMEGQESDAEVDGKTTGFYGGGDYDISEYDACGTSEDFSAVDTAAAAFTDQAQASTNEYVEEDTYDPIGFNPDEFFNNLLEDNKATKWEKQELLAAAEQRVRETKWALQRAGLPTDSLQTVMQDARRQADKLGKNLPAYVDMMLKMTVDTSIQRELRHPRKGRIYSLPDVDRMLLELGIRNSCWESYYNVAGLAS